MNKVPPSKEILGVYKIAIETLCQTPFVSRGYCKPGEGLLGGELDTFVERRIGILVELYSLVKRHAILESVAQCAVELLKEKLPPVVVGYSYRQSFVIQDDIEIPDLLDKALALLSTKTAEGLERVRKWDTP